MLNSKRKKQNRKHLEFYSRTFRLSTSPYQVLCDANFVHHFLQNKLGTSLDDLHQFVGKVLDSKQIKLLICESSLVELEAIFGKESDTYKFALQMEMTRCGRDEEESLATPPQTALRKLVGSGCNRKGYIVATQDDELKEHFRGVPGVPLLFFQRALLLLEAPSEASLKFHANQEQKKLQVPKFEKKRLRQEEEGGDVAAAATPSSSKTNKRTKRG